MLTEAVREPVAVGVNFTLIEQLAPTATLLPQVFVWEKSTGFAPVKPMLVRLKLAAPVLVSVMFCSALVVPVFCELKVRVAGERLTKGWGVGAGVPPPPELPPPQATQTPTTVSVVANNRAAGCRRIVDEPRSIPSASDPANIQISPTGKRNLGGLLIRSRGGILEAPMVVTVSVEVAVDGLVTVTGEETVHVAPAGQPLATLRLTNPTNPFTGVTVIVVVPACPGAGMLILEGFAAKLKSVRPTESQWFTRLAAFMEPSPVARSYPAVVVQAGVVLSTGLTRIQ